ELSPRPDEYKSTFQRHARISEMLPTVETTADMWKIAQDHLHYPQDSVCRHREPGAPGSFTTYASVFVLEELRAYIGLGNPCQIPSAAASEAGADGVRLDRRRIHGSVAANWR